VTNFSRPYEKEIEINGKFTLSNPLVGFALHLPKVFIKPIKNVDLTVR